MIFSNIEMGEFSKVDSLIKIPHHCDVTGMIRRIAGKSPLVTLLTNNVQLSDLLE